MNKSEKQKTICALEAILNKLCNVLQKVCVTDMHRCQDYQTGLVPFYGLSEYRPYQTAVN